MVPAVNSLPSETETSYFAAAVLHTFYRSCIEPVLTFLFLCWFGGLSVKSKNVFNKVANVFGKAVGERQAHLSQLYGMSLTKW